MLPKKIAMSVLLVLVVLVSIFPVVLTLNSLLTTIAEKLSWYTFLQNQVVPLQVKLVGLVVRPFGIAYIPLRDGMIANSMELHMTWNCLGWQSMLLFFASMIMAFWGMSFTRLSQLETLILGIFGIFWINILRMSLTVILAVYSMPVFHILYHDYLAAIMTIMYLVVFWWFSYSYILIEKKSADADVTV